MDNLTFPCALAGPGEDSFEITVDVGTSARHGEIALVTVIDGRDTARCYLTEERARELFNWLGVWLHTR